MPNITLYSVCDWTCWANQPQKIQISSSKVTFEFMPFWKLWKWTSFTLEKANGQALEVQKYKFASGHLIY